MDKRNGQVCFNNLTHTYWNENDGRRHTSVTTLIGQYCQEFNSDFWSQYKALQKLLSPAQFSMEKKHLLDTKKFDKKYFIDTYDLDETEFNSVQQDILDEWQRTNKASTDRGTSIHSDLEHMYTGKKKCTVKQYGVGGEFQVSADYYELDIERGVYPEYLIYYKSDDGVVRLAGQIDLLIKDGNDIYIVDYKTNKKLDEKSFFDTKTKKSQMMKYPINNLMDCNKVHYTLQLSLYAWMLQQINPDFVVKKLILVHYDHSGNVTEHEVEYLKDDVERLLKYYRKQCVLEELRDKRKPIEF